MNCRSQIIPVTGPLMKTKAEEIASTLGIADWQCSNGWLTRFKKRNNILVKTVCGERKSVDEESTDTFYIGTYLTRAQTSTKVYTNTRTSLHIHT